jgi:retinol dehydrogenase 12
VKRAAATFLAQETKLHVLWHNAGLLAPSDSTATVQGHDVQMAVHCVGPFLLTKLLENVLRSTSASANKDEVRVVWVSSSAATMGPPGGMDLENLDYHKENKSTVDRYYISKSGMFFLAGEFARRLEDGGVMSVVSQRIVLTWRGLTQV